MKTLFTLIFILLGVSAFSQTPTWSNDVAKIMYGNCTSCHHPGGIAPFSLTTYDDVSPMAAWLEQNMNNNNMPPWSADKNYKSYVHQRVLSEADKQTFSDWVDAGTPSGDLRFEPPVPTYSTGSQIGTADLSLIMNPYTITSSGDEYRNFVLQTGLTQSKFATTIEFIPGNTSIVHHVLVFVDSTNNPISPTGTGGTGSAASKLIYEYVPGALPYYTPVGTGIRLPANSRIIFQVHYASGSQGQTDASKINFKLSTASLRNITVNALLNEGTLTDGPLNIPANQIRTFNEAFPLPPIGSWTLLTASPHMHLLGKSFITYAVKNTAPFDTLRFVKINEWDFHWQDNYIFQNALKIPNGYTFRATAVYDNTAANPNNPSSPPQNVTYGENTLDEMMMVFFSYLPYQNGDEYLIIDKRIIPMGATTFCEGQSVRLKTIEGIGYTYQWKLNGTNISGATNYFYEASQAGNYTVLITLGPNSVTSDPVAITVNPKPIATINQPANYAVPQTLVGASCGSCTYQWYLNDLPINGATASSFAASQAGVYYLEAYNGCYAISDTLILGGAVPFTISVSASPTVGGSVSGGGSFELGTNATVTAVPNTGYSFVNWTENGNSVSTQSSYSFTVNQNRNLVANFDLLSSISEELLGKVLVYPNPNNGEFTVTSGEAFSLKVITMNGKDVLNGKEMTKEHILKLSVAGVYYVQIEKENGQREFVRVVVE
ncbi:MAG: InlB B-repeat-containing protein [Crocinitomicaceae bacterium]